MSRVYIFLADGFEEIEALCPYDLLLRAGVDVKTVSINDTTLVTGTHNIRMYADLCIADISANEDIDGIILPGGLPGADNLNNCQAVQDFITAAAEKDRLIAAICAAPYILGKRGLLRGKRATCFPGFEGRLESADYTAEKVEHDGNIITARGMGAAFDFGVEIIAHLMGEDIARQVAAKTQA